MLTLFAAHRDGTVEEQAAIRKTLIRMAEIAQAEDAPAPLFKVKRTATKLGGLFF